MGALLVSGVTYAMFGARWIYFGVLHFYWLATVISRPLLGLRAKLLPLGLLALVVGQWGMTAMDPRWLNWIGLAAHKPSTEDYAPLLPWIRSCGWVCGPESSPGLPVRKAIPLHARCPTGAFNGWGAMV